MAQIDWNKELDNIRNTGGDQPIPKPAVSSVPIDWNTEISGLRSEQPMTTPEQNIPILPPILPQQQIQPKRSFIETATTPISKLVTGKSMTERLQIPQRLEKYMTELSTKRGLEGKPISTAEAFLHGFPGQAAKVEMGLVDLTPADIALMGATAGVAKIPFRGVTVGEIATNIPVNKRFFQNIKEFSRYQDWLKLTSPVSSRGVSMEEAVRTGIPKISKSGQVYDIKELSKSPEFAENINLKKYPPDVRQTVSDLVTAKPELGKTPTISDNELISRAAQLKDTPTLKYLADLPEGTVESEALKLRMGNVDLIRKALGSELTDLKNTLDQSIEQGIGLHRKTASMFGRGLRQQRLPAETQQKMAFAIDDTIKRIQKDPIFSKDQDLVDTVKKLRSMVVDKEFNPTIWNQVYFAWLNAIVSNPFTHTTNSGSNVLFALMKIPEKFASAVWDLPLSWKTGKRTQFFGEIPAMIKGLASKQPLPAGLARGSKVDFMTTPIKGRLGKFIGTPTRLLQIEDDFAKNMVGRMEYHAQQYAGKTGEELIRSTNLEQLYRTFQNDTGAVAEGMMLLRSKIPGLRYVIPFIRTPANLIARGLERTPLGIAKIAHNARIGGYSQERLAQDLGNVTLGTIGAGLIGMQFAKGNVTGKAPRNPAERDAFYRQGKKPNAIRIGDNWIPLERLEPLGTSFSTIANLIQDYQESEGKFPTEKAMSAINGLGKTLINKTYLSGLTNMVNALSDPEMYGKGFLTKIATGLEPQILKFFSDLKDPYYREADTILDQLKTRMPGLSETLPAKMNVFGEPIKRDFMNIGKATQDPVEKMLQGFPIGFPGERVAGEKLIPQEYRWLLKSSGQDLKKRLMKISPEKFNQLPADKKEKIIDMLRRDTVKIPREILNVMRKSRLSSQ